MHTEIFVSIKLRMQHRNDLDYSGPSERKRNLEKSGLGELGLHCIFIHSMCYRSPNIVCLCPFFTICRLHFSELKDIGLASLHSILFCEHRNECQIVRLISCSSNSTMLIFAAVRYKLAHEASLRHSYYTRNNATFQALSMQMKWNLSYHPILWPTDGSLDILI